MIFLKVLLCQKHYKYYYAVGRELMHVGQQRYKYENDSPCIKKKLYLLMRTPVRFRDAGTGIK